MRYKRVLFICPFFSGEWRGIRPHLGLGYLSQMLLDSGIDNDVLDMNLGYKFRDVVKKIADYKPDLVGMPLISLEYNRYYDLLGSIKKNHPDVRIIVGGPHVTIMKEKVMSDCPAIDYGAVFEAEHTLTELCKGEKQEKDIIGMLLREDGKIIYTGDRPFQRDLDAIPFPRYERFELDKYQQEVTIYSSRGCPHLCTFCPNRLISPVFRVRSPQNVIEEMEFWYQKGFRQFNFDDDNFNMIKERVYEICDEIEKKGFKDLFLRCSNGIRADKVDYDLLKRMKQIGFRYITFGVDGGNNRILELVKKGETIESIESAIKASCDLGYDVKLLFVIGTPGETLEDVEDKVRIAQRYPIQEVHFYNTIPYPGTELFDYVKENNLFLIPPEEYLNNVSCLTNVPVFETPELPGALRKETLKRLWKVRKGIHKQAFLRMFKRYRFFGVLLSHFLSIGIVEKLFYQNIFFRNLVERFRYRIAVKN